jgi:hypothetical protein
MQFRTKKKSNQFNVAHKTPLAKELHTHIPTRPTEDSGNYEDGVLNSGLFGKFTVKVKIHTYN